MFSVFQLPEYFLLAVKIIFGKWGLQDHVDRARKFILITVPILPTVIVAILLMLDIQI